MSPQPLPAPASEIPQALAELEEEIGLLERVLAQFVDRTLPVSRPLLEKLPPPAGKPHEPTISPFAMALTALRAKLTYMRAVLEDAHGRLSL